MTATKCCRLLRGQAQSKFEPATRRFFLPLDKGGLRGVEKEMAEPLPGSSLRRLDGGFEDGPALEDGVVPG